MGVLEKNIHPSISSIFFIVDKEDAELLYFKGWIEDYQRNIVLLLVKEYRSLHLQLGVGMLMQRCVIFIMINEAGNLVGRPILTACIDAYSSLCVGYSLSWKVEYTV